MLDGKRESCEEIEQEVDYWKTDNHKQANYKVVGKWNSSKMTEKRWTEEKVLENEGSAGSKPSQDFFF